MNFKFLLTFIFLISLTSCGVYNFTGGSLDDRYQSIKVDRFPNYSSYQNPNYSQEFTNDLQLRFDQRTSMSLTNQDDADIILEGEIQDYYVSPVSITSGEQAAQNRLTIKVKVIYTNNIEEDKSFSRTFTDFEDFPANQTLQQVEAALVPDINTRLIDQIFTAVIADW
ncbi:MAG: LptE family protein [Flavobacteriaceae bacterium]|nr:LptE family protein [Flavobacteriaceae bacterium]